MPLALICMGFSWDWVDFAGHLEGDGAWGGGL